MKPWQTSSANPGGQPKTLTGTKELPNKCWEIGARVKECELAPKTKPSIVLPLFVSQAIIALCDKFPKHEWLAYLQGKVDGDNYIVTHMEVPEQQVSTGEVEVLATKAALGTVHSHHSMGAFHSSTDDTYIGGNHEVTVVVDNHGGYAAKVKRKLPCGATILVVADVLLEQPKVTGVDAFVAEAAPRIKEKVYAVTTNVGYGGLFYCGQCHQLVPVEQRVWINNICYHLNCADKAINSGEKYSPENYWDCFPCP